MALGQIEKQFGKGSIMRMGDAPSMAIETISTGAMALDLALGVGGLPRGRIVEIYGPEASGKCLTADTYIWTDQGLETVSELFERCGQVASCTSLITDISALGVRAVNERGELEKVAALTHNDRRPVVRIRLASGRAVKVTANHPLRVTDGAGSIVWREAGEIRPGDVVVSALFGALESGSGSWIEEDEAVLLGYLAAEGSAGGAAFRSTDDPEVADEYHRLAGRYLGTAVGTDHAGGAGETVPHPIRVGGDKVQRAFLSALFAGGGRVDPSSSAIGLSTTSEQLAQEVQLLLYGLGIPASVSSELGPDRKRRHWTVTVHHSVAHRFAEEIGLRSRRWHAQVEPGSEAGQGGSVVDARFTYERVVDVEDAGEQPTFDLVLPRTHSFLANGTLSHNTTLATHVVAEAQRNGGICAYIDAEHAMDPVYAKGIGVNIDDLLISQPDTGEQALEIADTLIRSGALDVIVIDSVAALTPRAELEGDMGDTHVGLQARLMSQALRKITANLSRSKTIAVFINQLREKVGVVYGSSETQPGGRALKFYSSVRLDIRRIESIKDGAEVVGNRTRVKVVKNKVSAPYRQAEFDIMYGKGISREGSLLDVAVDRGLVKKSGAWFTYDGEQLGQGRENAKQFLSDNPEVMIELFEKIRQQVGIGVNLADDVPLGEGIDDDEPILLKD